MTFPSINYKFNDLAEAQALTELIEKKCEAFSKYLHDNDAVTCEIEFQKVAPQQNGQVHQVEANLQINGTLYRAVATEETFEKAIDEVRDELDKELRTAKEKQVTRDKQAGREAKEMMMEAQV
ncbi:ribosome-associated translation inhibitor RaiA [Candidatus Nomurabacteria bacterium]|nr:ribosome-associated translation inhibitor RaiA [Candidatus Nomurabacteria bacterium]